MNKKLPVLIFNLLLLMYLFSAESGIDVGNKAVDFSLKVLSSTSTFKLSDYENKNPLLIVFFATWCPACGGEIRDLNGIYGDYGNKGLEVVGINVQEREDKVANFAKRKKIHYKIVLDANSHVATEFKVYGIPTNILINSKGVIVFRSSNLPDDGEIERVLPKKKWKKKK